MAMRLSLLASKVFLWRLRGDFAELTLNGH